MSDNLKKYIDQNRSSFEEDRDDLEGLWLGISSKLDAAESRKKFEFRDLWKIAAILLVFVGIAWLVLLNPMRQNQKQLCNLYKFSPELAEAEGYYSGLIEIKMQEINNYRDDIDPRIFEDLEALDQALKELENDLEDNIDNEEVINAMIKNYRIKLEILEKIQSELEQQENEQIES